MRLPALEGVIDRRLLVNYRVDPEIAARWLPAPFRPQLVNGFAVAGICLIRLVKLRPVGAPRWAGLTSENAAHRIAVEWPTKTGIARVCSFPDVTAMPPRTSRSAAGSTQVVTTALLFRSTKASMALFESHLAVETAV